MGTYYRVFMGCYLKIPVTNKPVTKQFYKKPSGKRASTRFNPETGEEYELCTEIVNEKEYPSTHIEDRQDLDDNEFYEPEYAGVDKNKFSIFLPNRTDANKLIGDTEYDFEISVENLIPELEITKFKRKYSKYLDYFTKKYPNLEVKFGIVRHGS